MTVTAEKKARILALYDEHRRKNGRQLPPVSGVEVRPNVRRLASVGAPREGGRVLNLSSAVVRAGEPAWQVLAPALAGDGASLQRLRELTRDLVHENRRTVGRRNGQGPGPEVPPPPRCQGTPGQRSFLRLLVDCLRHSSGYGELFPSRLHLRISRRMTRALGSSSVRGGWRRITVAERLFRPGLEDILWETVKHEVAHLLDEVTRDDGRSSHGPTWRQWARRLGARPERLCTPAEVTRIELARRGSTVSNSPPSASSLREEACQEEALQLQGRISKCRHPGSGLHYPELVQEWLKRNRADPPGSS